MQILQTEEDLFRDDLDQGNWDAGLVVPFDESEEIFSERFKNDADVDILGCAVMERIDERNDVLVARVRRVCVLHSTEQFDLVSGGFGVSAGGLYYLES